MFEATPTWTLRTLGSYSEFCTKYGPLAGGCAAAAPADLPLSHLGILGQDIGGDVSVTQARAHILRIIFRCT